MTAAASDDIIYLTRRLQERSSVMNPLDLTSKLGNPVVVDRLSFIPADGLRPGPVVVDLDPTSFCDLSCPSCISAGVLGTGRFTEARLLHLVEEFSALGVLGVVLIGGGEPLMHPSISRVMNHLFDTGIKIGLVTNGTHMHKFFDTLSAKTSWIRVSIDAATAETFERLRPTLSGVNRFTQVCENIEHLASTSQCYLGMSFVVMPGTPTEPGNLAEISSAAQLAEELGCAYLELKALMNKDHTTAWYGHQAKSSIIEELRLEVDRCGARIPIYVAGNLTSVLQEPAAVQLKDYTHCPSTLLRTVVAPSGVYPCAYHRGDRRWAYEGSPVSVDFARIWAGAAGGSPNPSIDCNFYCARHTLNEQLSSRPSGIQSTGGETDVFI